MAIRALSEFEHIRLCPGNYIGGTETPTHLLYELIDNSADECITGNSKFLAVIMNYDDNKYTVVDKGRGIPLKSKEFKEDAPVIIATKLFTGGKFDNDLYQHRSGLHGEGLVIVNALSTAFEIITKNKDKHRQYTFNGQNVEIKDIEQKKYSTSVSFSPDPTYFDTVVIDKDVIEARLKSILVYNKEKDIEMILIIIKDDKITKIEIKDTIVQEFESDCDKFINTQISSKKDELSLYVGCSSENKTKKFKGIINTLNVDMGTHQKMIENILREYLYEKAVKNKMHVNKEDVFIGGRILAIMKITNPAFAGQTKYALNMKESMIDHIINKNSIVKFLDANADFVDYWLNIAQSYRIEIDSKKQTKTRKSRNIIIVDDLKDCLSNDLEERELFLLEGQSAGGTLQLARDINIHAILPLRGKVLNVLNVDKKKVFNSKAIMNIFTAMNVKPFSEDLSGLRYGKTIILCDADPDGKHIASLLLSMFTYCLPKIITEGRLYVVETPLFGCYDKKNFVPLYTEEDVEKAKKKNLTIFRYKGLGEMQPNELSACAIDKNKRKMIKVLEETTNLTVKDVWVDKNSLINEYFSSAN
jgi:DNA gyrase/topoisomerase IV subunit B